MVFGDPDPRVARRKRAAARARGRGNEERALVALGREGMIGPVHGGPQTQDARIAVPARPERLWPDDFDAPA